MTNAIELLAAASCSESINHSDIPCTCGESTADNLCEPCDVLVSHNCPTCGGTGALVPGLRRECHGNDLRDAPAYHGKRYEYASGEDCGCQGRGWVLIPVAEVMGVLVRVALTLPRPLIEIWPNLIKIIQGNLCCGLANIIDTPEEALASALCQVYSINS